MTWKGARQLPGRSLTMSWMTSGVRIAPRAAPLWRTPLPRVRSRRESRRSEVVSAQGHWPASKKPSRTRQASRLEKLFAHPVA
jgi:hypothetical protein